MGLVAAEQCPQRIARREWMQGPQQGRVESLPFLQQNGTIGLAETSLMLVPFQERCDKAEVGLTGLGTAESEV